MFFFSLKAQRERARGEKKRSELIRFPTFFSLHHTHKNPSPSAPWRVSSTGGRAPRRRSRLLCPRKSSRGLFPRCTRSAGNSTTSGAASASAASSSSSRRLRQVPQRLLRPCLPTLTSPRWLSSRGTAERPRASRQRGAWRSSTCSGRRWRVRGEQRVFPLIFLHPLFLLLLLVYRLSLLLSSSPSPTASRPL